MNLSYSDILITLVIVGVVLFAAHRLGQVNPVGTGKLARRLGAMELIVAEQGQKLDSLGRAVDIVATSSAETARSLEAIRMEIAGDRGLAERTWSAVDRLQAFFIQDAFDKRSGR